MPEYGQWDLLIKKAGHFIAYAILALLGRWAGLNSISALLLSLAYAVSDEFHQRFVPGRNGTPLDVIIDGLGAATALAAAHLLAVRRRKSRSDRRDSSGAQSPRGV